MELTIKDRIYIPSILPEQNKFAEFALKRSIIKKVEITESDKETYHIKEDRENGRVTWDPQIDKNTPLIVDFSNDEIGYLKSACEKLAETDYPDDFWQVVEKIYDAAL